MRVGRGLTRVGATVALVVAATATAGSAGAQVNVEAVRGDAKRPGLSGRAEASATGRTGNTEGIIAGASGRLQLRSGRHLSFVYGSGNYTRFNAETSVAKAMGHLRYNYEILRWLWGEAYAQVEHNKFQRLTNRELLGAGPRFRVHDDDTIGIYYGTSYMAEWENLDLADGDASDSTTLSHRWSHYVNLSADLNETLSTGTTFYMQPRFDRFSDYRVLNETYFEVGLTDVISAKASTWLRYDSEPPDEVKRTDFLIANAFVVKF